MTEDQRAPLNPTQVGILMSPIHSSRVKTLSKGGRGFSYVEAYDIRATLIRLFGFGGFSITVDDAQVVNMEQVASKKGGASNYRATAMATVTLFIPRLGCTYRETAASSQVNPEPGEALDFAVKTAASDALKRCGANLGTQFGLSLYDNGSRQDIVRVMFDEEQSASWAAHQEATAEQRADAQQATQGVVDRATGQESA